MTVNIGLMGFGRIGRNIFRILRNHPSIQVTAISDIADHAALEYLLKYDTIFGRYPDTVKVQDGALFTRGRKIAMLDGRGPGDIDWGAHGVDIVIEATARYRSRDELDKHLEHGAKKVILCAPPKDAPDATIVYGTNHHDLKPEHRVISNASVTAHCAAPLLRILDEAFGVDRAFFTSVHGYTNDLRLADVPGDDLRRSRAASENIIPTESKTPALLQALFPSLEGNIEGMALSVPVPNGAMLDLSTFLREDVSAADVNAVLETGIDAHYKGIVDFATDPIVSSDVKASPFSSTVDSLATTVVGDRLVKTIAWCDNAWGYAHRAVDLVAHLAELSNLGESRS